ncbi:MAG: FAD synthase [Methanosarcinaceae archaeon]|jgi:FAD synthetase|nr:FAD synthase [Methanosarcinaceae archaeon]NKQ38001.1 FAD synthase [Methanosarcinales archaeon]
MIRVLATGTFDILHVGHIYYLKEARALGTELFVILARDSMIQHKPKPIISENSRLLMINSLKVVKKAVLGSEVDIFEPLKEINPDIIALGYDQKFNVEQLDIDLKKKGFDIKIVRIGKSDMDYLCSSGKIVKKIIQRQDLE